MWRAQDPARSARSRKNGARSATIKSRAPGALKLALLHYCMEALNYLIQFNIIFMNMLVKFNLIISNLLNFLDCNVFNEVFYIYYIKILQISTKPNLLQPSYLIVSLWDIKYDKILSSKTYIFGLVWNYIEYSNPVQKFEK